MKSTGNSSASANSCSVLVVALHNQLAVRCNHMRSRDPVHCIATQVQIIKDLKVYLNEVSPALSLVPWNDSTVVSVYNSLAFALHI
jgi:hypothetical protein